MFCDNCSSNCNTCEGTNENCTSCSDELYYYEPDHECRSECPDGYFEEEGNLCKLCGDALTDCELCENGEECLDCIDGSYLNPISKICEG